MDWSRRAMLLAFPAATVAGMGAFDPPADAGTVSTLACYVALANDLTPLVDPGMPDFAAATPECVAQAAAARARAAGRTGVPAPVGSGKAAKPG